MEALGWIFIVLVSILFLRFLAWPVFVGLVTNFGPIVLFILRIIWTALRLVGRGMTHVFRFQPRLTPAHEGHQSTGQPSREQPEQHHMAFAGANAGIKAQPLRQQPVIKQPAPVSNDAQLQQRLLEQSIKAKPVEVDEPTLRSATLAAIDKLPDTISLVNRSGMKIPLIYNGEAWQCIDLMENEHYGVYGTSRSGKGNLLQIISLFLLDMGPEKVQLCILDAKNGLDYTFAKRIEHASLYVNEQLDDGCKFVNDERRRREVLLEQADARNIHEYNAVSGAKSLPFFVVIADEMRDFNAAQKKELESTASMGLTTGCILISATQYPTMDVIPQGVQANTTKRFVFRLVSAEHSGVALRRRAKSDPKTYEPSVIPSSLKGVCVLRTDGGQEFLGRAPELTDELRQQWIAQLIRDYPKAETEEPAKPSQSAAPAQPVVSSGPKWTEQHVKIAAAIGENPNTSVRALGRVLYPSTDGGGDYSATAKRIRQEVEQVLGVPLEV